MTSPPDQGQEDTSPQDAPRHDAPEDDAPGDDAPGDDAPPEDAPGSDAQGDDPQGDDGQGDTVAALRAAVRAVERGERSADSFFTEPPARRPTGTPPAPQAPAAAPDPAAAGATGPDPSPELLTVLAEGGAPDTLAGPVTRLLGERAAALLREDPWRLLAVPGVRPEQADGFARALLGGACGPDDRRRGRALAEWLLHRAARAGHTVLPAAELHRRLGRLAVPDPEEAVRGAVEDGALLMFRQEGPEPGRGGEPADSTGGGEEPAEAPVTLLCGLERYAVAEESLADNLTRLRDAPHPRQGDPGASAWEAAAGAAPSPSAAALIRAVADSGLIVHTGGEAARAEPAALVAAARRLGLRACAAAHSADGRQRLARLVADAADTFESVAEERGAPRSADAGPAAVTVAGLLSGQEGPGRAADGTLDLDLLAVLDAPQLDAETAAALAESLPDGARLVLSGDPHLLGAAGAGRPFTDVLAARCCPQVVSRTPDPGPLGELVSGVGVGELHRVAAPEREVVVVPVRDAGEAVHRTVQLVTDSVPRALGIPAAQTQVVTAGHGGAAGTRVLNAALKERLNPGPGRFAGFDPGDRVAYTPVPGHTSVGTVASADAEGLHLELGGPTVVVPRGRVGETVRHGWAVTAHQAAGLRWPAVVVVVPGDAGATLDRSWVYTAFSRGERHLSVVQGSGEALPRAVAERPATPCHTRLRALLREQSPVVG